jgi:hypothetical protein
MARVIVLTQEEASKVRGISPLTGSDEIDPMPLEDGRFFLGVEVLEDPAHEDVREFLASLPREPLEKLPVYTEADEQLATEEVASFKTRAAIWTREEIDAFRDNVPVRKK